MATLGELAVGSIVKLNVDGVATNFIVVQQGSPSADYVNADGTWLLMKDIYTLMSETTDSGYIYPDSSIHTYVNDTFYNLLDDGIKNVIKQVKIPYNHSSSSNNVMSGANGLSAKIFLLSNGELGLAGTPTVGNTLSYFEDGDFTKRVAYNNSGAVVWYTRSNFAINILKAMGWYLISATGALYTAKYTEPAGIRPAMVLPSNISVDGSGNIVTNTAPGKPSSITVPSPIYGGDPVTVSWGAATDADGNLSGYVLERSVNGGSTWSQIYSGAARTYTDTLPDGAATVMYRVKATDSAGAQSGYRTSVNVAVQYSNVYVYMGGTWRRAKEIYVGGNKAFPKLEINAELI